MRFNAKKKRPVGVQSAYFDTQQEAEASEDWWRLSWEQGHKGKRIDAGAQPDEDSADDSLPQGEFILLLLLLADCCKCAAGNDGRFTSGSVITSTHVQLMAITIKNVLLHYTCTAVPVQHALLLPFWSPWLKYFCAYFTGKNIL